MGKIKNISKYIWSNQMTIMPLVKFARQCFAKKGLPKNVLTEERGGMQSICQPDSIKVVFAALCPVAEKGFKVSVLGVVTG